MTRSESVVHSDPSSFVRDVGVDEVEVAAEQESHPSVSLPVGELKGDWR